ncbi:Charged multivesicular body protein 7 [Geranomyces michiganensis]|nr:Charged multivesicular body protein 7 [Geranomyces michiganensis]
MSPIPQTLDAYLASLPGWAGTDAESNHKIHSVFRSFNGLSRAAHSDKVEFWRTVILEASCKGFLGNDLTILDVTGLENRFRRRGLAPQGLDVVVADMIRRNDLVPLAQYRGEVGWGSWAVSSLVIAPLKWGLSQLVTMSKSPPLQGSFVVTETVEAAHYNLDHLLSFSEFKARVSDACSSHLATQQPTAADIGLVQRYLEKHGQAAFSPSKQTGEMIVKVRQESQKGSALKITETDFGVVKLRATEKMLHEQIDNLEGQITHCANMAKERLKLGERQRALYLLRRKKLATGILQKRIGSLETIEGIIGKMQAAESDSEILAAYAMGSSSLKTFMASSGLTADAVDATMDNLQETLADAHEVDAAMQSGQSAMMSNVDLEELEEELSQLAQDELSASLPAVPSTPLPSIHTPFPQEPAVDYEALDAELDELGRAEPLAA